MPRFWRPGAGYEPTPFAQLLHDIRAKYWIPSWYALADEIAVSGPTVIKWVRDGVVTRDAGILSRISRQYNVPLEQLYESVGLQPAVPPPAAYTPVPSLPGDEFEDAYMRLRHLFPPEIAEKFIASMEHERAQLGPASKATAAGRRRWVEAEHTVNPFDGATDVLPAVRPAVPTVTPAPLAETQRHVSQSEIASVEETEQQQRAYQARSGQPNGDNPTLQERRGARRRRSPAHAAPTEARQ